MQYILKLWKVESGKLEEGTHMNRLVSSEKT